MAVVLVVVDGGENTNQLCKPVNVVAIKIIYCVRRYLECLLWECDVGVWIGVEEKAISLISDVKDFKDHIQPNDKQSSSNVDKVSIATDQIPDAISDKKDEDEAKSNHDELNPNLNQDNERFSYQRKEQDQREFEKIDEFRS